MTSPRGKARGVHYSQKINAPVNDVASLVEDVGNAPSWHPLVNSVVPKKGGGRGLGSTVEWKAELAKREVFGVSEAIVWDPGKEYIWKGTESGSDVSFEVRVVLQPSGKGMTEVSADMSYQIPDDIAPLVADEGLQGLLRRDLQNVLHHMDQRMKRR